MEQICSDWSHFYLFILYSFQGNQHGFLRCLCILKLRYKKIFELFLKNVIGT